MNLAIFATCSCGGGDGEVDELFTISFADTDLTFGTMDCNLTKFRPCGTTLDSGRDLTTTRLTLESNA